MTILLSPAAGEPEFSDPTLAGEWATEFPKMLGGVQNLPWCSYAARRNGTLVGFGGFKTPPDPEKWVEIGYMTLIPAQGSGVASAVCALLLDIAAQAEAAGVRAHTLPEHNPSTRVLSANGFVRVGEIIDPEDGLVWRWEHRFA